MNPLTTPAPWTLIAEGYQQVTQPFLEPFSTAGLARLRLDHRHSAIDVACGPGTTSLLLASLVSRVVCVDFSEGMLAQLQRNRVAAGIRNVEPHLADGQQLPFPDECFDVGVSMFGIIFFTDHRRGFRELHRVLRPGGQMLVSSWAPLRQSPMMQLMHGALQAADPSLAAPDEDHTSLENPDALRQDLESAGFRNVVIEAVERGIHVSDIVDFWRKLSRGAAPLALLRQQLSEAEWRDREEAVIEHLVRKMPQLPTTLTSTAWIATAVR